MIICIEPGMVPSSFLKFQEIDYLTTFAPVVKLTPISVLLFIVVSEIPELDHRYVVIAFLNSGLKEKVYKVHQCGFKK